MKYRKLKPYKYQLWEDEQLNVEIYEQTCHPYITLNLGVLIVRKYYAWDGSSIPFKKLFRILTLGIYKPDKHCKTASLVHDALCQLMREDLLSKDYKEYADGLYRDMCIAGGLNKKEANRRYWVLRKFGQSGIKKEKNPRDQIYETKTPP